MKQTLKITISPTKPKGIAYKLRTKKMPHPPFHMEKEGGAGKGLKTTIEEGIVIPNLTKKITPILSSWKDGWGNNYNKWSSMAMLFPSICAWGSPSPFAFSCYSNGTTTTFSWSFIIKIVISKFKIFLTCFSNIFTHFHLLVLTISLGTNGTTSSTFACYPITLAPKCLSFTTPPMPSTTFIETYWSTPAFFAFFQVCN